MKKNKVILFFPTVGKLESPRVPFALLYLERAVRGLDVEIILIDENTELDYISRIEPLLDSLLLVGVSVMIGEQIESCVSFSKYIKSKCRALTVWGGWYPSQLPEQVLKEPYVDMVVIGQGEIPFKNLLIALLENKPPEGIKGLGFKENQNLVVNAPGTMVNPSELPEVNYGLIDITKYYNKEDCSIGYNATFGCPFNCTFCSTALLFKHKWMHKSISEIVKDLTYLKNSLPDLQHVIFEDDNFFADKEFIMDLVKKLADLNLKINWSASAHASLFLKLFTYWLA